MPGKFHHEQIYRGPELLAKLAAVRVTLCGVGAVGSNLADNLVRQGVANLRAIDKDRVEEHNVSTQSYGEADVGVWKVEALRNRLFKVAGVEIDAVRKELTGQNAKQLLGDCDLVVDALDNFASRQLVQETARASGVPCLHVGLYEDYCEVIWDQRYRVPKDVAGDVCDYPLARNLALLAVVIASEQILKFVGAGERTDWSGTLGDLAVRQIDD
jgi:molybdopterin/thiamine biosynthesis adenylyltransferase